MKKILKRILQRLYLSTALLLVTCPVFAFDTFPYQKPGADIHLLAPGPLTLETGQLVQETVKLKPGDTQQLLEISVRDARGFEFVSEQKVWLVESQGKRIELPIELRVGDTPGNYALNLLVRSWPQESIDHIAQLREQGGSINRVLGLAIKVQDSSSSLSLQKVQASQSSEQPEYVQDGSQKRKVHWMDARKKQNKSAQ